MEQRVSAITIGVKDLARSRAFYVDGLGWRSENESEEILFFQLPGIMLMLFPLAELAKDEQVSVSKLGTGAVVLCHNVRQRTEVDQVLDRAVRSGATLLKPAQDAVWGGRSGYFADPDGHPWEVAWNPAWTISSEGYVTFGV